MEFSVVMSRFSKTFLDLFLEFSLESIYIATSNLYIILKNDINTNL